jgi:hypothetical protein
MVEETTTIEQRLQYCFHAVALDYVEQHEGGAGQTFRPAFEF